MEIKMKEFIQENVTYKVNQKLNGGIQYRADYEDGQWAAAFIKGKKHTRQQVIDAINKVNVRSDNDE